MNDLFSHLKEVFLEEPFEVNQSAYSITVYTNLDYAAIKYMHMLNAIKENMTGHILRNSKSIESLDFQLI